MKDQYGIRHFSQFVGAEMIAKKYGHTKEALDAYSVRSHQRGRDARNAGAFDKEIVAIMGRTADGGKALHQHDEGIRDDASMEAMAQLKILMEDGALRPPTPVRFVMAALLS